MDDEKKDRFDRMARRSGKSSSEVIRELVDDYIQRNDMRSYLKTAMDEIGHEMKRKGVTQPEINKAVKEVRLQARLRKL